MRSKEFTDATDETERRKKERRKTTETEEIKTILLDTNIFMEYGPFAVFQYGKNNILIIPPVRDELNHRKTENSQRTISFFEKITEKYTLTEIKKGVKISNLPELVFGKPMRTLASGLLFFQTEEPKNDPFVFSEEFKEGEIIAVIVKTKNGEEKSISISKEVALHVRKAFHNIQDREILSIAKHLFESEENILLITNDSHLREEARLAGICAKKHVHEKNAVTSKNASQRRPGRRTSQRRKNWN